MKLNNTIEKLKTVSNTISYDLTIDNN